MIQRLRVACFCCSLAKVASLTSYWLRRTLATRCTVPRPTGRMAVQAVVRAAQILFPVRYTTVGEVG